ncbi:MAG TPA: AAA family ATPase [Thermoanaerobaculia bacterium]|nr:AAA family ATPase [Thermoanaerobaculia bacterium]
MRDEWLRGILLRRDKVEAWSSFDEYPFNLPAVRNLHSLEFTKPVTYFVGENGSGKSTLIEAIAIKWGFNPEGGSTAFRFSTAQSHSDLFDYLRLIRAPHRPSDGFFLRAESFFNVATQVDELGVHGYGDKSLHKQSHGESFLTLMMERFRGDGLYILDEPEAALSPNRQLAMIARMHQLVRDASQFLIATHSPILMAYPDATILSCDGDAIHEIAYEETEHYTVTRDFLNHRRAMLKELLS